MTRDPRLRQIDTPALVPLFDIVVDLQPRLEIGDGGLGRRVLFAAAGGSFHGPELSGDVLPGGGDWALFRVDGVMTLDVRLTLRTTEGALIHMSYGGRWCVPSDLHGELRDPVKRLAIDPADYYFRTNPLFETGAAAYAWLNDIVCAGVGYLVEGGVAYRVFRLL
jgi:hypothetical protein